MKRSWMLIGIILWMLLSTFTFAQGTLEDYKRAERFLPWNVEKMISLIPAPPVENKNSSSFWYLRRSPEGKQFMLVDVAKGTHAPAFDHARLADRLSTATGNPVDAKDLPFQSIFFLPGCKAVQFQIKKENWVCDLQSYTCTKADTSPAESHESLSPDRNWIAYVENFNLFVRSARTGEIIQLSRDGKERYDYATEDYYDPPFRLSENDTPRKKDVSVIWSPDSRKLFTYKTDLRKAQDTHLIQSAVPGSMRALHFSYPYPLPGEEEITTMEPVIFDIVQRKQIPVQWRPLLGPLISWRLPRGFWSPEGGKVYFIDMMRGYKTVYLVEADASTGKARKIIEETSPSLVDHNVQQIRITRDGRTVFWASERTGWNHLYRFDGKTGIMKNAVTKGEWPVRSIEKIDEKKGVLYFTAGGREPGRDPYFRHLYRIGMDGSGLRLLTPEDADHQIYFPVGSDWFVDRFSRVDTISRTVVRRSSDGRILIDLGKPDIEPLSTAGWKGIEPFRAKARDGKTDIFGVIFRPTNLDESKKYPVIENIYSGPHSFSTPKQFPLRGWDMTNSFLSQSLAEIGFIVVIIDGMGQNHRGQAFRNVQYQNLADCGFPDRIAAIRQLAERYPYMDTSRVGIFGFSAGGYAAARALLDHPDFYKVAVAASGNYDHRMDKLSWNERWMGHPIGDQYEKQSDITDATKLKGKLLLCYGDLDTNVPPASTVKMVHALIQANKDFDLLVFPNEGHYLEENPYFNRKRWDYFTQHLLGVTPPPEYRISKK